MLGVIESILASVARRDRAGRGVTVRDIRRDVELSAPTITKYLRQLKARGYVDYVVRDHRPNCKKRMWTITERGRDFVIELQASSMFAYIEGVENEQS